MSGGRVVAGLGLAALLIVWFALQPTRPDEATASGPGAAPFDPVTLDPTPTKPARATASAAAVASADRVAAADADAPSDAPRRAGLDPVEAYIRYAVYPPNSRPLDARQTDLIDWNRRHESPRADPDDPETSILFTADRYHVVGAQTLSAVLDVRRGDAPAAVQVLDAHVELPDGRTAPVALDARDGVHVGLIEPAGFGLDAAARIRVEATFDAGAGPRTARFFATYVPEDVVPARFGAPLGDRAVDGGLEVSVEVHVERAGLYLFDANLYAAGEPVGWTRSKPFLEPGTHRLDLRFFGKVLADRGLAGPYTVEQLRGALAAPGETPATVQMAPYEGSISTAAYGVGDFSAAEWDDPKKQRRIARLKRLEAIGGPVVTTPAWRDE